jgi:hypothetical protein
MAQLPEDVARRIIEDSLYLVLATADGTGRPGCCTPLVRARWVISLGYEEIKRRSSRPTLS